MHLEKLIFASRCTPQASKHVFGALINVIHKPGDGAIHIHLVFVKHIRNDIIFEPFPQAFDGVQLRGIRGQKEEVKPIPLLAQEIFHHLGMVD